MSTTCPVCSSASQSGNTYCQVCGTQLTAQLSQVRPVQTVQITPSTATYTLQGADGAAHTLLMPETVVGRLAGCDIVLGDQSVSGRHAKFIWQSGQWMVEDLGSSNGTRINGSRIGANRPTQVPVGGQVELGSWQGSLQTSGQHGSGYAPTVRINVPTGHSPMPTSTFSPVVMSQRKGSLTSSRSATLFKNMGNWMKQLRNQLPGLPTGSAQAKGTRQPPPGALAAGIVTGVSGEDSMVPGWDASKFMVKLSIWLLILGSLVIYGLHNWIGLLILLLPVGFLLWSLRYVGLFLMPFGMFSLFGGGRNKTPSDLGPKGFHWSVSDYQSQQVVSGRLVRKPNGTGQISMGDEVSIYGRLNRDNLVEARVIIITQKAGMPTWSRIVGQRPWPWGIGLLSLLAVLIEWLWLANYLKVISVWPI